MILDLFLSFVIISILFTIIISLITFLERRLSSPKDCCVKINGDRVVHTVTGISLLDALKSDNIFIPTSCAGEAKCGLCKCKVINDSEPLPTELGLLTASEINQGVRLACQLKLKEDIAISLPLSILNSKKMQATVIKVESCSQFIKRLHIRLNLDEPIHIQPGSYFQIKIPQYEMQLSDLFAESIPETLVQYSDLQIINTEVLDRAYSLANYGETLELVINVKFSVFRDSEYLFARGASYLFSLKEGDAIQLQGSYGAECSLDNYEDICFVLGGVGISTAITYVEYLVSHFENKNIYLFYGVNDSDEFLYMELLEKLEEEKRLHLFPVALTAGTSTPSTLYNGYVSDQLRKEFLEKRPDEIDQFFYYLCGPKPMIEATKNVLEEFEVDSSMFFSDSF